MKVLILDNERTWRGGQEQIFTLIRGLHARGLKVALISPPGAPLSERVSRMGVTHYPLNWSGELNLHEVHLFMRILGQGCWDVIHFNTPRGIGTAAFLSRHAEIPVRVLSRRVNFPLSTPLSRWKYLYAADQIITVSSGIAETLIHSGIPANRIEVVYEGVDVDEIEQSVTIRKFPSHDLVIGCVAYLSEEKGHKTLFESFARVVRRHPEARLLLVGDGPLRGELEAMSARLGLTEFVHFTGFKEEVSPYLLGLDIFVLPSLSEGLSSGILGAMAASLPVVASNIGGIPELVLHGVTGLLVPPRQPQVLADNLMTLLESAELRKSLGSAGRERVLAHFTLEQKVEKTLAVYDSLLQATRGAKRAAG